MEKNTATIRVTAHSIRTAENVPMVRIFEEIQTIYEYLCQFFSLCDKFIYRICHFHTFIEFQFIEIWNQRSTFSMTIVDKSKEFLSSSHMYCDTIGEMVMKTKFNKMFARNSREHFSDPFRNCVRFSNPPIIWQYVVQLEVHGKLMSCRIDSL